MLQLQPLSRAVSRRSPIRCRGSNSGCHALCTARQCAGMQNFDPPTSLNHPSFLSPAEPPPHCLISILPTQCLCKAPCGYHALPRTYALLPLNPSSPLLAVAPLRASPLAPPAQWAIVHISVHPSIRSVPPLPCRPPPPHLPYGPGVLTDVGCPFACMVFSVVESQSRPSYSPSPLGAHVPWMCQ